MQINYVSPQRAHEGPAIEWVKSFAEAVKAARQTGKPVFVYVWNYG